MPKAAWLLWAPLFTSWVWMEGGLGGDLAEGGVGGEEGGAWLVEFSHETQIMELSISDSQF